MNRISAEPTRIERNNMLPTSSPDNRGYHVRIETPLNIPEPGRIDFQCTQPTLPNHDQHLVRI
jgi:hypothetical protein